MTLICGIDEAGRGPLIGPLVMAGVTIEDSDEQKLKAIGVKDSKLLSHEQRESMFERIKEAVKDYLIIIVPVSEIDDAVNGKGGLNLNKLEAKKTAVILNKLKPEIAYVDCPSTNTSAYNSLLIHQLAFPIKKLITEHKADHKYPSASAASILAKVTRDREIERIKDSLGVDFGSGYLTDPKTMEFLKKNYEIHKDIFRKSWFPYQDIVNKKFQKKLEDFSQFVKQESKAKGHALEDLKILEGHGFTFETPKTEHELAVMKGPCTVILYKNGTLLVQGKEESKKICNKLLGLE